MATIPTNSNDNAGNDSSVSTSASTFEVFLSFRGIDTRNGFTDFLYTYLVGASIRTFRDDNELRVGEEIGPELLKAIKESKVSIPIFSTNYAYSKWCLRELAQMWECHTTQRQMIFPIFYDVDPDTVKHQKKSYEKAFRQHREMGLDEKIVQGWEEALTKVGKMKGLELEKETGGHEGELVKIVVEKVLTLVKNYKHEPQKLVGMVNHTEKLMGILNVESSGVHIVGIHGMGGLGKTTIARAIYNKLNEIFECHCFLEDVRENSNRNNLHDLQNQLLSKILKRQIPKINNVYEGINQIKEAIQGKKVFIVLDDVDEMSQVDMLVGIHNWYGGGSRIILTTRNKDILDELERSCQVDGLLDVYHSYKPNFMDDDQSLQLFSKYAFRRDSPPEDYNILAKEVVSIAAGLPLVLKTLGSLLFAAKDKHSWEEKLKKLKAIPHTKVMEKLRLSYDALENEQKQIFLDIACLFTGKDKTNPCYMWDDCEFYPGDVLNVLVCRSLITVGDDNKLRMHDQLRDLGRHIVREKHPNKPGKWSRLWQFDKALPTFETHRGTENIEALCLRFELEGRENCFLTRQDFHQLPNLRYLSMENTDLGGDFKDLLSNLRWLECSILGKFTPTNFHLKNLLVLDLSRSNIDAHWGGWSQIMMAKRLKVLKLSNCKHLWTVPHLSAFANLERLELDSCSSLSGLYGLEQLESLNYLNVSRCAALTSLRDLSKLKKLQTLNVSDCKNIAVIEGLDKLESLELLYMRRCMSLETLPNLSNMKKLKRIDAAACINLIKIQGSYPFESLEHLDMRSCLRIERLPDLSNLKRLKKFDISMYSERTKIQGLDRLESLEHFSMSLCYDIERLPDFSNLRKLNKLDINRCSKLVCIQGLHGLESLEHFRMYECHSLERLPDFSNLRKLKELSIKSCDKLIEIRGLDKLESLGSLELCNLISMEKLPDLPNFGMLKVIDLSRCPNLHEVEGLQVVESLERLTLYGCGALGEILDLPSLNNLKTLRIISHEGLTEIRGLEELRSLEYIEIRWCNSIEKLPDFSSLEKLKEINASNCVKLTEIRGLEELKSLTKMCILGSELVENLPNLPNTTIKRLYSQ